MPTSKSTHVGRASSSCEITSGGVRSMPTMKQPTITYGRLLAIPSAVAIPDQASMKVAMGISNAKPKAKNILSTKSR